MYKNVQVNHSNNATGSTIPSSSSSSSSLPSQTNQNVTSLPVQITSGFSPSSSSSTTTTTTHQPNSNIADSGIALPVSYKSSDPTMSSSSKDKADVDQLDNLVKDLLSEVNRPITTTNQRYSYQRHSNTDLNDSPRFQFEQPQHSKTTREERIRIKRGTGTDIPVTTSSSTTTTTTTTNNKSQIPSASIDEHLIDSLLESVQNTLKKRAAQQSQANWSSHIPVSNRRTYSSSATYNDTIPRTEASRGRFPIKLYRTDSPTSTISSRRPYSRQDNRDGYGSASTTAIPTHFRATSEPPPEGPIELRRMDLIRSPSRTYVDSYAPHEYYQYSRPAMPSSAGIRVRGRDYSGYDTDTGLMTSRGYAPRYYRGPPPPPAPPPPMYPYHPYYHHYDSQRSMFRPDGYDTDSGLVSSGRVHMARTLPPRMAVIPETVVVNNRIIPGSNINTMPSSIRTSSFANQSHRSGHVAGYETDSGMNTRQYRQVPVDVQYGDSGWVGHQSMARTNNQRYHQTQEQHRGTSIPVFSRQSEQHQQKRTISTPPPPSMETTKKESSAFASLFSGSVGLSNPIGATKTQQHTEVKRNISLDSPSKRAARSHAAIIDNTLIQSSTDSGVTKTTTAEIVSNTNGENQSSKTPTFPVINQSYNANVQTRVGNSSLRSQEESSRRSSVSSVAESDVSRTGAYQAHNVSRFWYKEKMSRDDAVNLLKTKPPGTFLIRDSQGFPGSYGLAVKVETLPAGIHSKPGADPQAELVRHYLIERTPTGHVRLKGCPNEPDFANLSALVYQHTLTPLALPTKLVLPTVDIAQDYRPASTQPQETKKISIKDLLEKGAACNVIYLNNVDVESLSGQMAAAKALRSTFDNVERLQPTTVNFKVSNTGITLTDTKKKIFSRRHFPKEYVTYCGVDYETDRYWTHQFSDLEMLPRARCFGFVSKKINGNKSSQTAENECHIFAEVDPSQPASAIVNFVSKVMIGSVPV